MLHKIHAFQKNINNKARSAWHIRQLGLIFSVLLILILSAQVAMAEGELICIDPGHGGSDPGAVGCGLRESDVVLETGLKLKADLLASGFSVVMTRTTDTSVSLSSRTAYANSQGAYRYMSIHANSAASVATGTETYCYISGSSNSFDMRDKIQEEMIDAWSLRDRGGKTASFYVIKYTSMPATLSELGFINNCDIDATYLGSSTELKKAARSHLHALQRHLGQDITNPDGDEPELDTGELLGVIYKDKGVGSADMSERLPGATVSLVDSSDITTATGYNAVYSFDALEVGTYIVEVSLDGFESRQVSCTVYADQSNWCSIGLVEDQTIYTGEARGVVYEIRQPNDMLVRLTGATINVDGSNLSTSATGEDAMWSFTLFPDNYKITASMPGYEHGFTYCDVVAGEETWCSIGLFVKPVFLPGTLKGVVYENSGSGINNTRIPDAKVTVIKTGDEAIATGDEALWSFLLSPSVYVIEAELDGYLGNRKTCFVSSDQTTWCSIGLLKESRGDNGELRGIVYEDVGVGAGNTSNRLTGAAISIEETLDSVAAIGDNAYWSISLQPGIYTVEASFSGYQSNTVNCEVIEGRVSWCSIGLKE